MRNLAINKSSLYVLNYLGQIELLDTKGNKTGETTNSYSKPRPFKASVSGARGYAQAEMFGTEINYDKTIILSVSLFKELCITENSVLFVDKKPKYDSNNFPLYDYKVERIAETPNQIAIAIKKVKAN